MAQAPHEPTEESRALVSKLAGYGMQRPEIASILGIGKTALGKHYKAELARGDANAKAAILGSAFRQAMGAPAEFDEDGNMVRPYTPPNPTMTIFLAKTRGGLIETQRRELSGPNGKPVKTENETVAKVQLHMQPEDADL